MSARKPRKADISKLIHALADTYRMDRAACRMNLAPRMGDIDTLVPAYLLGRQLVSTLARRPCMQYCG